VDGATYRYQGEFRPGQGTCGYTVRVRPSHPDLVYRFELPLVAWAPAF